MGILHNSLTLLIFGILSLTIVDGRKSNADHLLDGIRSMVKENQLLEPGTFDQKYREFKEKAKTTCAVNGGPFAYKDAESGWEHFADCVDFVSAISARTGNEPLVNRLDPYINQWCPKVHPFDLCIELFSISINPCLGEDERDIIDTLWKSVMSFLDYLCENEGEHIKTFYNDKGIQCIVAHQEALTACVESFEADATSKNVSLAKLPLYGPSITECESLDGFQRCTIKVIGECNQPSIPEIIESLFNILSEESGCKELLKSNASPTSVINFFVVIASIAMFL